MDRGRRIGGGGRSIAYGLVGSDSRSLEGLEVEEILRGEGLSRDQTVERHNIWSIKVLDSRVDGGRAWWL